MEDKKIYRAFNEMYIVAQKRLENRSPIDIAKKAGGVFCEDTSTLKIKSLDKTIELIYPSYEPKQKLEDWYILILLHYLVTLNIWFADEEFKVSGKMLVDKSADHYLTMEDSVMVGEFMLRCISERYKQLYDAF